MSFRTLPAYIHPPPLGQGWPDTPQGSGVACADHPTPLIGVGGSPAGLFRKGSVEVWGGGRPKEGPSRV